MLIGLQLRGLAVDSVKVSKMSCLVNRRSLHKKSDQRESISEEAKKKPPLRIIWYVLSCPYILLAPCSSIVDYVSRGSSCPTIRIEGQNVVVKDRDG